MKYLIKYKLFESKESKYFFVALRDTSDIINSLYKKKFYKISGISSTINIINSWLDVRSILLVMPYDEVIKNNNVERINYFDF